MAEGAECRELARREEIAKASHPVQRRGRTLVEPGRRALILEHQARTLPPDPEKAERVARALRVADPPRRGMRIGYLEVTLHSRSDVFIIYAQ